MDINLRTDQSPEASVDHENPGRPPESPVPSMPVTPDDTIRPDPAQQPQTRAFTLFKRLPVELRFLIWEFACAPAGPRIHFLEPIAIPDEHPVGEDPGSERKRTSRIHWGSSVHTNDPRFQWSGRELLSVCIDSRRVFLDQKNTNVTSRTEQTQVERSNMVQTTDIICIRAGTAIKGLFIRPLDPWNFVGVELELAQRGERPSPRRLALEVPAAAYSIFCGGWRFQYVRPNWLRHGSDKQKFMRFVRLEVVYIFDQHIKPRAQYDHQEVMPHELYTEAFEGHNGSRFVAIDPEDKQAIQLWIIPEHCRRIVEFSQHFPDNDYRSHLLDPPFLPNPKLRFLACVKEGLQTQPIDDGSSKSAFAFVTKEPLMRTA